MAGKPKLPAVRSSYATFFSSFALHYIDLNEADYEQGKYRSDESRKVHQLIRDAKIEIGTHGYDDPGSDCGYGSKINISFYKPLPP